MLYDGAVTARTTLVFIVSSLLFAACDDAALSVHPGSPDAAIAPAGDEDDDGIGNAVEGSGDPDGDGVPNYADPDSDGDGITDRIETIDDSDYDHVPNYLDLDSDENGITDAEEGTGDFDGDGRYDFRDLDDDRDRVTDARELALSGPTEDTDGDGAPNWRDRDSDGDTIADREEWGRECGDDDVPDVLDTDSDDDGWLDADEAGDENVISAPIDTDGDGWSDSCDIDSDGDALLDADERARGTNRLVWDSDYDGVADPFELREGTDPLDPTSFSPLDRAVFVVPYLGPCTPSVWVRTVLGDDQPLEPSLAHATYSTTDAETQPWVSYIYAYSSSRAPRDCTPRTAVDGNDGYSDARRGDVLCWNVAASTNETLPGAKRVATIFEGRVTVEIEGGVPIVHPVYFVLPAR